MITINIDKARAIAHHTRREARAREFAPHDEAVAKRIPGTIEAQAEAARSAIRLKYADIQARIDAASDASELKSILLDISLGK